MTVISSGFVCVPRYKCFRGSSLLSSLDTTKGSVLVAHQNVTYNSRYGAVDEESQSKTQIVALWFSADFDSVQETSALISVETVNVMLRRGFCARRRQQRDSKRPLCLVWTARPESNSQRNKQSCFHFRSSDIFSESVQHQQLSQDNDTHKEYNKIADPQIIGTSSINYKQHEQVFDRISRSFLHIFSSFTHKSLISAPSTIQTNKHWKQWCLIPAFHTVKSREIATIPHQPLEHKQEGNLEISKFCSACDTKKVQMAFTQRRQFHFRCFSL